MASCSWKADPEGWEPLRNSMLSLSAFVDGRDICGNPPLGVEVIIYKLLKRVCKELVQLLAHMEALPWNNFREVGFVDNKKQIHLLGWQLERFGLLLNKNILRILLDQPFPPHSQALTAHPPHFPLRNASQPHHILTIKYSSLVSGLGGGPSPHPTAGVNNGLLVAKYLTCTFMSAAARSVHGSLVLAWNLIRLLVCIWVSTVCEL